MESFANPKKPENRHASAPALLLHGLSLFLCLAIVAYPDNANAQRKARGAAPAAEAAGAELARFVLLFSRVWPILHAQRGMSIMTNASEYSEREHVNQQ